jgi:hypothetical protein
MLDYRTEAVFLPVIFHLSSDLPDPINAFKTPVIAPLIDLVA